MPANILLLWTFMYYNIALVRSHVYVVLCYMRVQEIQTVHSYFYRDILSPNYQSIPEIPLATIFGT